MNLEQLNSARLARWSQNGEARLTLETMAEWMDAIGFCPYLPSGNAVPAASFLEAVVGRPAQSPSASERTRAQELLARMVENSAAVPLKIGNLLGEQPDFIASPEVLRYLYALRGDRNFKGSPSTVGNDKVTTLALHCWQAIQEKGPLGISALQPILGRDITEAAIARALQELWTGLYIFPVLRAGDNPATWDLLIRKFPQPVAAGASTGHAEAQSALVSLYLQAVVAAQEEEVLRFLSPLAPQSKLREVIRGLGSMRQLDMIDISGRVHLCLQGGLLPEMVAQLSAEHFAGAAAGAEEEAAAVEAERMASGTGEDRIEIERQPPSSYGAGEAKKFVPKKFVPREFKKVGTGEKPFRARPSESRSFAASAGRNFPAKEQGFKKKHFSSDAPGFDARKSATHGPGERARRWEKAGDGAARPSGTGGFQRKPPYKSEGFKSAGSRLGKPWMSKDSSAGREGAKPWKKRDFGAAPSHRDGEERPKRWQKPGEGSNAPGGNRRPYGAKPFKPGGAKPWARKASGEFGGDREVRRQKPEAGFGARPAGRKPWASKGAESRVGSAKSYADRTLRTADGEAPRGPRKTYGKPGGAKPWGRRAPSEGSSGDRPQRREKPGAKSDTPGREKGGAKPFWAKNPRGGKGSAPASRTNRPRGGKKSGKKK